MDVTTHKTADDARKAREAEYGAYVANEPISVNGAPAFNTGDAVPVSTVRRYRLEGAVRRVGGADKTQDKPEK